MNDDSGWVKLHRKILESRVFKNEGLFKVWMYCLCRANHQKCFVPIRTGRGVTEVEVNPGEFIFGRKSASIDLDMNESTVQKRMKKLESMGYLIMQSNTHYSIVSICNWETYQDNDIKKEQQKYQPSNNQVTTKYQPSNTDKNDKNDKNDKKNILFENFWKMYDKKKGKADASRKWDKLSQKDIDLIFKHVPKYVNDTPDVKYRKDASTYLNQKVWLDELDYRTTQNTNQNIIDAGTF